MLAGALIESGIDVEIYDACVGDDDDDLQEVFYKTTELPSGMLRTGVSDQRILDKVYAYSVIGVTSIFSHQETMALHIIRLIKKAYPDKLLISGGVNARNRMDKFFEAGVDVICTSEAEKTIVDVVKLYATGSEDFSNIPFLVFKRNGVITPTGVTGKICWDLDELPIPAWHLLPNNRYWEIGRPHGGHFDGRKKFSYASMMTSLGCPFSCTYCHVASEVSGSISSEIGRFRIKSEDRVMREMEILKDMGVDYIFIEDDSIFGRKKRGIKIIRKMIGMGLNLLDVNGINIIHLLRKGEPDIEVIELLVQAGFKDIALPFETANKRIISRYCSNKWDIDNSNVSGLIQTCKEYGLRVSGNFMIGYPDESIDEIFNTINFAKDRKKDGLDAVNFFLVMPLPGTPMFDEAVAGGYLPQDFDPDKMHWQKANMINTPVPAEELEAIRDHAWQSLNNREHVDYKKSMLSFAGE